MFQSCLAKHGIFNKLAKTYSLLRIRPTFQEARAYNATNSILLTFDDYGDKDTIEALLVILKKYNVRAVFFLIGTWANKNNELVMKIKKEGHWIGNHTASHKKLKTLSDNEIEKEITNGLKSQLLRPPFGAYNNRVRKITNKLGYKIAFWTIDSEDWKGISALEIQKNVLCNLHFGACVLMHINGAHTLESLPGIITGIREQGFDLCCTGKEISL